MAVRPISTVGDPSLRKVATAVGYGEFGSSELLALLADLTDTLRTSEGIGLSAPQIGISKRVIVIEIRPATETMNQIYGPNLEQMDRRALPLLVMFNPRITSESDQRVTFFEWCLSADTYAALVSRPLSIEVEFQDALGNSHRQAFEGWASRVIKHEIEHLDGWLCLDHAIPRSLVSTESWRNLWARRDVEEVCLEFGVACHRDGA